MVETLRPCEVNGICYYLKALVPSVRENWKEACPIISRNMKQGTPDMQLQDDECVFAVAHAWAATKTAPELQEGE